MEIDDRGRWMLLAFVVWFVGCWSCLAVGRGVLLGSFGQEDVQDSGWLEDEEDGSVSGFDVCVSRVYSGLVWQE